MSQYCRCGSKFSFETATKRAAPFSWQATEVWVCGRCDKISHAVQEAVEVVRGPEGARALLNATKYLDGTSRLQWRAADGSRVETIEYRTYPRKVPMSETEPLIFKTWQHLQTKVTLILDDSLNAAPEKERAKFEARGIAEVLAILMKPFVEDADEVVRHAVRYHKDPHYDVPGLGLHLWDPLKNVDGTERTPISEGKKTSPFKKKAEPQVRLTEDQKTSIRSALAGGVGAADLAPLFGVPVETIQSLSS